MISVILNCQPMDEKMFRKKKIARVISCWIFRLNSVTTSSCHQIRKWAILHLHIISIKRRTWILCELSKDYSNFDITFKSKKRNYLPYSKYWWQSLLFHFFFFFLLLTTRYLFQWKVDNGSVDQVRAAKKKKVAFIHSTLSFLYTIFDPNTQNRNSSEPNEWRDKRNICEHMKRRVTYE